MLLQNTVALLFLVLPTIVPVLANPAADFELEDRAPEPAAPSANLDYCPPETDFEYGRNCFPKCGFDRPGSFYLKRRVADFETCIDQCGLDPRCRTAQYHRSSRFCYFKTSRNTAIASPNQVDTVDCDQLNYYTTSPRTGAPTSTGPPALQTKCTPEQDGFCAPCYCIITTDDDKPTCVNSWTCLTCYADIDCRGFFNSYGDPAKCGFDPYRRCGPSGTFCAYPGYGKGCPPYSSTTMKSTTVQTPAMIERAFETVI